MFYPEVGLDALRLLEQEGIEVLFPEDQTCCGQPACASGHHDQARAVVTHRLALCPRLRSPILSTPSERSP